MYSRFLQFGLDIAMVATLAIGLGIIINNFVNWIGKQFNLNKIAIFIIQMLFIIYLFYIIRDYFPYIFHQKGQIREDYAIFITLFFASQKNIVDFVGKIIHKNI